MFLSAANFIFSLWFLFLCCLYIYIYISLFFACFHLIEAVQLVAMSLTPRRPSSSTKTTRRVSFSPVIDEILSSVEKRRERLQSALDSAAAEPENDVAVDLNPSQPTTTSHRTRIATSHSPVRRPPSVSTPSSSGMESHANTTNTAATATTVEFSLKDIPLDGKMAPPVWREPSPGRHHSSRRASPSRGETPMSARLSKAEPQDSEPVNAYATPSTARRPSSNNDSSSNPFTDVARDSANLLRRQRVVRTFFVSHEDAVRLYIRLQQLLHYRDLCHSEFQQRLRFLNSEEERQAALADRARRLEAQEKEIQRIQAALARADVTSPEFTSSMSSLYSTRSGTPLERAARRGGSTAGNARGGKQQQQQQQLPRPTGAPTTATAAKSQRAVTRSAKAMDDAARDDGAAAKRPFFAPRYASPRDALEAWRRRSQSQDPAKSTESAALETAETASLLSHQHRGSNGRTPRDSLSSPNAAVSPPHSAAPPGNADSEVLPNDATSGSLPSSFLTDTRAATTDEGGKPNQHKAAAPAAPRSAVDLLNTSRALLPLPPISPESKPTAKPSVAGLVTPPRAQGSLQAAASLVSGDTGATPRSTDSPLARFRRRQGYEDPVVHFREQLSNSATPLRSQSPLGSTASSPSHKRGELHTSTKSKPVGWAGGKKEKDDATVDTAEVPNYEAKKPAVGPGTALLLTSERARERAAAPQNRTTEAPARHLVSTSSPERNITAKSPKDSKAAAGDEAKPISSAQTPQAQPRGSVYSPDRRNHTPSARVTALAATASPVRSMDRKASPAFKAAAPTRSTDFTADSVKEASTPQEVEPDGQKRAFSPVVSAAQPPKDTAAAVLVDIQSWSPADPPIPETRENDTSSSKDAQTDLVPSVRASQSPSEPHHSSQPRADSARSPPRDASTRTPEKVVVAITANTTTAAASDDHSIWDDLAALECRVGRLEGRTAELERNATKRAVLDAIRLLRDRVTLLEDRTAVLQRDQDKAAVQVHVVCNDEGTSVNVSPTFPRCT